MDHKRPKYNNFAANDVSLIKDPDNNQNETIKTNDAKDHPFLNLSNDVQHTIFSFLEPPDLIALATTNKQWRRFLLERIFKTISIDWGKISEEFKYSNYVQELKISDCNSYGEWHADIFSYLDKFPNLEHFLLNSSNSSNWLKYRSNHSFHSLTLFFDKSNTSVVRRGSLVRGGDRRGSDVSKTPKELPLKTDTNNDIPGSSIHSGSHLTGNNSGSPRIFNLGHLANFSLTSLTLYNYHFNWEPSDVIASSLENLSIHDCTWEYPFMLSQFNHGSKLKNLSLCYSTNNSFILSERFNKFLNNEHDGLEDNFKSVKSLSITFINRPLSWERTLSLRLINTFLNDLCPELSSLKLHGWTLNVNSINQMLTNAHLEKHNLSLLDLAVYDSSKDYDQSTVKVAKLSVKHKCPWIDFRFRVNKLN